MDDLSNLSESLGSGGGAELGSAMGGLAGAIQESGGLDGLVGRLRSNGLGEEVDTWVATGSNAQVDPQRLGDALGPDTVQRLSAGSGLDISALLPLLAAFLPQLVNMLTPSGRVPDGGLDGAVGSGGLGDLGGLLGGLMGGGSGAGGAGLDDLLGGLSGMLGGDKGR
jgi:uncharacterized protein YidB (DUF937 family)